MLVEDILKDLQYGELATHGMFMENTLSVENREKLIYHLNIALTALYTRFPLLTRELTVIQLAGRTLYPLESKYAVTDKVNVGYDKFILDNLDYPYNDDLIKVISVYDEIGNEVRINDSMACPVIFTPAANVLEIPQVTDTNALFVIYQAKHPKVNTAGDILSLPINFKPALLSYIAHRVYSGGTAQEHVTKANEMLQKYELFCAQQREYGTDNSQEHERNVKPCLGGWV